MIKYIHNLLLAIDRLGNAIAGGNSISTISARVGFIASERNAISWKAIRACIDWCFYPIDGKHHCQQATEYERQFGHSFVSGNAFALIIILSFVMIICPTLGVVIRLALIIWGFISKLKRFNDGS